MQVPSKTKDKYRLRKYILIVHHWQNLHMVDISWKMTFFLNTSVTKKFSTHSIAHDWPIRAAESEPATPIVTAAAKVAMILTTHNNLIFVKLLFGWIVRSFFSSSNKKIDKNTTVRPAIRLRHDNDLKGHI